MSIPSEPETHLWRVQRPDEVTCELHELHIGDVILAKDHIRRANPMSNAEAASMPKQTAYWGELIQIDTITLKTTNLVVLKRRLADGTIHDWPVHDGYAWLKKL